MIVSDQREHCTEETSGLWQVQHQQVGTISDLKFHILPSDISDISFIFIFPLSSERNMASPKPTSVYPFSTFPRYKANVCL